MNWLRARQNTIGVARVTAILAVIALALIFFRTSGVKADAPATAPQPMQLSTVSIPLETLAASTPSNVWYTAASSKGPFCLEGFVVSASPQGVVSPPTGSAVIYLEYIDGTGLSYPSFTLFDGNTGGSSPQDIVLSYGNHICAHGSIEFQATEYAGPPGIAIDLFGQAIVLSEPANKITITGSTTEPSRRGK